MTDSVFSMDGTLADLTRLVAIKKEFNCWLYVDEAHATGVFGEEGQGLAHALGVHHEVDVSVGTLSKALGSQGGFVCGNQSLIDYLVNTARSFIYSTGLSPFACGVAYAGIHLLKSSKEAMEKLWKNKKLFEEITGLKSDSPIVPVIIGDEQKALDLSQKLLEEGFYVKAIRPPTVPLHTSRLRITITATHSEEQIKHLGNILSAKILDN